MVRILKISVNSIFWYLFSVAVFFGILNIGVFGWSNITTGRKQLFSDIIQFADYQMHTTIAAHKQILLQDGNIPAENSEVELQFYFPDIDKFSGLWNEKLLLEIASDLKNIRAAWQHYHKRTQEHTSSTNAFNEFQNALLALKNKYEEERKENKDRATIAVYVFWGNSILFVFVLLLVVKVRISRPVRRVAAMSGNLASGNFSAISNSPGSIPVEFQDLLHNLNKTSQKLIKIAELIDEIGNDAFEGNYEEIKDDFVGKALLNMREQLKNSSLSDEKRRWANEGHNKIAGILRIDQDDVNVLGNKILSGLVNYMQANQGGLFLLKKDEDSRYLELLSAYAWERRKFIDKRVELGDGLLGQAVYEEDTIYVTNVPDDFVDITSGLGEANPTSILVVPLKFEDEIYGAVEMAFFKKLEQHQVEFVEKVAENIAAVISNIIRNENTRKLLQESQQLTEQMKSQEEELKHKSFELESAKEGLSIKLEEATREMKLQIKEIEKERKKNIAILEGCVDGVITFDQRGRIEFFNKTAEEIFGVEKDSVIGRAITDVVPLQLTEVNGKVNAFYAKNGVTAPIGVRTEVTIENNNEDEISVLLTISDGLVGEETVFALFIQQISVELF